jgi:asparagine synthetase B (glutamine-hydrolysing)
LLGLLNSNKQWGAIVTILQGDCDDAGPVWDNPEVLRKITYLEHCLRLPEHLLMRVDKMTMAHSIEARVPFLDHDIVHFARRLPNATSWRTEWVKKSSKRLPNRMSMVI